MRKYHGWIVLEEPAPGMNPPVYVEHDCQNGERYRSQKGWGNSGATQAVEWWEQRIGKPILLEPTLKGCYRVYTEEEKAS